MAERSTWRYSIALNRAFEMCSWLSLLVIVLDVLGLVLGETNQGPLYIEKPGWPRWLGIGQLVTLTIGSSLIYLFIYRKQHERAQKFIAARAGVSA